MKATVKDVLVLEMYAKDPQALNRWWRTIPGWEQTRIILRPTTEVIRGRVRLWSSADEDLVQILDSEDAAIFDPSAKPANGSLIANLTSATAGPAGPIPADRQDPPRSSPARDALRRWLHQRSDRA